MLSKQAWEEIARYLKLSGREVQMAKGIFDGATDGQISDSLGISEHTVHTHFNRLFNKLDVSTRVGVVLRVIEELFTLTLSPASTLPSICREQKAGRCPLCRLRG